MFYQSFPVKEVVTENIQYLNLGWLLLLHRVPKSLRTHLWFFIKPEILSNNKC